MGIAASEDWLAIGGMGLSVGLLPQWTEKADKRGLDPLGMQNSGVVLYQSLLPGISNVTLRMRYYGFYCWVSESYARHGATTDFESWRNWIRRAEALYALVAARAEEGGVGGVDWANRRLQAGGRSIDFAAAASTDASEERYLRQSLGVFGGAYYTQMAEMGLFTQNRHGIQVATRDLGRRAAALFAEAIGADLAKLLRKKIVDAQVSIRKLDRLGPIAPSEIAEDSDERAFYETLLFATEPTPISSGQSRGASLYLILETARAIQDRPRPDDVRWHLFDPPQIGLPQRLEDQRRHWELYHCQDLMQVASAGLLAWAIGILQEVDAGRTVGEIRAEVVERLTARNDQDLSGAWVTLRDGISPEEFGFQDAWATLTSRRGSVEDKAALAIRLMAALDQRVLTRPDLTETLLRDLPIRGGAHSLRTELEWFRAGKALPVIDRIGDYIVERVVRRHSWVAMQKLRRQRDYTFLFETRDGRLVYLSGYQPVPTTPRLAPAIQFLEDINLVDDDGLTRRGLQVLEAAR